jgi:TPR repeat protein
VPKGYDKALEWFQTAVDNNDNVNAVYYIVNIYYKGGYGIKMNTKEPYHAIKEQPQMIMQ